MGCYHPMIRAETFDGRITIVKASEDEVNLDNRMKKIRNMMYKRYDLIPCGQCIGCRLEYSRQWASRIMLEAKNSKNNWFVTLTYDDMNVPSKTVLDQETGELNEYLNLQKEDLQKFMKKLRRHYEYHYGLTNIRYYAAGEYGSLTMRPHYHACIFNMPIDGEKLKFYKNNENGDALFTCEEIEEIWGKGFVTIGELTYESAGYTARYITKKQFGKGTDEYYKGREREFSIMSRKPGIGRMYFEKNKEKIYRNDEIPMRGRMIKPPRYFDGIMKEEDPEKMQTIKNRRKMMSDKLDTLKDAQTLYSRQERREIEERTKQMKGKALIRDL